MGIACTLLHLDERNIHFSLEACLEGSNRTKNINVGKYQCHALEQGERG